MLHWREPDGLLLRRDLLTHDSGEFLYVFSVAESDVYHPIWAEIFHDILRHILPLLLPCSGDIKECRLMGDLVAHR